MIILIDWLNFSCVCVSQIFCFLFSKRFSKKFYSSKRFSKISWDLLRLLNRNLDWYFMQNFNTHFTHRSVSVLQVFTSALSRSTKPQLLTYLLAYSNILRADLENSVRPFSFFLLYISVIQSVLLPCSSVNKDL